MTATAPQFLSTPEAALYLGGLKPNTLEQWRLQGRGPRFYKISRLCKYSIADLDEWLAGQIRNSTTQHNAGGK